MNSGSWWIHETAYGKLGTASSNHEDFVTGQRRQFTAALQLWFKILFLCSQAMEINAAKAAVDQGMGKLEKTSAWNLTKVRDKSEVIDEARTKGAKDRFAPLMDICHLKNAELEAKKHQKYKGRVVVRGDIVKDDSGFSAICSQITRIISITNDGSRSHGYHLQIAGLRWTSSGRSISFWYPSKNGRGCSQIIENSQNWNVHTFGFVYHDTEWLKIMVQYGRPSSSSWAESVRSSLGRAVVGKAIWEDPFEVRLEKVFHLGMFIRTPWKNGILICVCGMTSNWLERKYSSDVERTQILFLTMKTADVLKDTVKWEKILLTITKPRENPVISARVIEKIPWSENVRIFSWFLDMEMPRNVEGLNLAPHVHEQKTTSNYI